MHLDKRHIGLYHFFNTMNYLVCHENDTILHYAGKNWDHPDRGKDLIEQMHISVSGDPQVSSNCLLNATFGMNYHISKYLIYRVQFLSSTSLSKHFTIYLLLSLSSLFQSFFFTITGLFYGICIGVGVSKLSQ